MQGYRLSMEDAHSALLELPPHQNTTFLGVFDGHGGAQASKFCSSEIHRRCAASPTLAESDLKQIVLAADTEFLRDDNELRGHGSTCVFALIRFDEEDAKDPSSSTKFHITVSNTGDSRAVWGTTTPNVEPRWVQVTEDHKPTSVVERERIGKANGIVSNGRVDGDLSVSRAIGDWQFKADPNLPLFEQKVSPEPDVTQMVARPGDWLLLACDGIFERLTTERVAAFVTESLVQFADPVQTANSLCDYALDSGSKDNMTTVLLYFRDGVEWTKSEPGGDGKPFFVDGQLYPEDAGFMNAYRRFAAENGFGDRVPNPAGGGGGGGAQGGTGGGSAADDGSTPAAVLGSGGNPIMELIAQLARENHSVGSGAGGAQPNELDDSEEETTGMDVDVHYPKPGPEQ